MKLTFMKLEIYFIFIIEVVVGGVVVLEFILIKISLPLMYGNAEVTTILETHLDIMQTSSTTA